MAFALLVVAGMQAHGQELAGYWKGFLDIGGNRQEICFDLIWHEDGYTATMDVPQSGAFDIPTTIETKNDMEMRITIDAIQAVYEGYLFKSIINGTFRQSGMEINIVLSKGEKPKQMRPQEPKAPFPYKEEEVKFTNKRDKVTLAGTLTLPEGKGPFPAVVLISGSGAQNRDEECFGHKPFAVIADWFARNGIATLRYDDRGMGGSDKGGANDNTDNFSYDAAAAVKFLRDRGGFSKVGVAGHSEGGEIAFILGARGVPDFIVSLAGPSLKGSAVLATQQRAIYEASKVPEYAIEANANLFSMVFSAIDAAKTIEEAEPEIDKVIANIPDEQKTVMKQQLLNPWMFHFIKYDPAADIAATKCPALILNGEKDKQVIATANIPVYEKMAKDDPKKEFIIQTFPDLNHMFQHCKTGLTNEYGTIQETISEEVLDLMTAFIKSK